MGQVKEKHNTTHMTHVSLALLIDASNSNALEVNFDLIFELVGTFALRNTTWMEQK